MKTEQVLKLMERLNKETFEEIAAAIGRLDKSVKALERELLDMILNDFLVKLDFKDGNLTASVSNLSRVTELDRLFERFFQLFVRGQLSEFASDLLKMWDLSKMYFDKTGHPAESIKKVASKVEIVQKRIGVTPTGRLVKGGYLAELGQTAAVRQQLKNYVLNAINNKMSLADYTKGFRQLVVGNQNVDGALVKYYRQYAYDSFNQVHEVANQTFAEGLGLKYFIYEGSTINTSREFCRKRAGKVFSTDEAKKWKNDPDLIEPSTRQSYNPLIERGRYNCRHFIRYISEELAFELRPDLKQKAKK